MPYHPFFLLNNIRLLVCLDIGSSTLVAPVGYACYDYLAEHDYRYNAVRYDFIRSLRACFNPSDFRRISGGQVTKRLFQSQRLIR